MLNQGNVYKKRWVMRINNQNKLNAHYSQALYTYSDIVVIVALVNESGKSSLPADRLKGKRHHILNLLFIAVDSCEVSNYFRIIKPSTVETA